MSRTEAEIIRKWSAGEVPLVSITCIAYNHEKFVAAAIEGFLMQETNFPFEIIIHDDASTDNTQQIIKEYNEKYPNLIRPILQTENYWLGKGINATTTIVWPSCKGKYIAWCEGDDYWTDPYKLQKQVDFLEANPSFSLSSTRYRKCNADTNEMFEDELAHLFIPGDQGMQITMEAFFANWVTKTLTVVIRKSCLNIQALENYRYFRDTHLFYHLLSTGPGYLHNFISGVYNMHANGVWSAQSDFNKLVTATNVFGELYHRNKTSWLLNKYLDTLQQLIQRLMNDSSRPLFDTTIYTRLLQHFRASGSFLFLLRTMRQATRATFSNNH